MHEEIIGLRRIIPYLAVLLLATLAYLMIYGYQILNPCYTDWLLDMGDLSQHYIGWQAFRNSEWMFPIGLMDQLSFPFKVSIIFTDSIPLFAVVFKVFRGLLPDKFQYFGLWGLLCFNLQGVFVYRIINRIVRNNAYSVLSSLFFVFAPIMIFRMYSHTALAGQWLLLAAIDLYFVDYYETKCVLSMKDYNNIVIKWAILGCLTASVHIYFVLMCGVIVAGSGILNFLTQKSRLIKSISIVLAYIVAAGSTIAFLGGFSSSVHPSADGLGSYSFNLDALFNPQGWSKLLKDLPLYVESQYEGFAYLGAGMIVLLILMIAVLIGSEQFHESLKDHEELVISISSILLLALIVSLSPIITLGSHVLVTVPLNKIFNGVWSIFRATGRVSWIIVYFIMVLVLTVIYKIIDNHVAYVLVALMIVLQLFDIHGQIISRHLKFDQHVVYDSSLKTNTFWDEIGKNDTIKHVILTFDFPSNNNGWSIADWAMQYHKSLNTFGFARYGNEQSKSYLNELLNNPSENELFIFDEENPIETNEYNLYFYKVDNYIIGTKTLLKGYNTLDQKKGNISTYNFGDHCVINGEDETNSRIIHSGGISYGPYWRLPAGNYVVKIFGDNLNYSSIESYSESGKTIHEISNIQVYSKFITCNLKLNEDSQSFEFIIRNLTDTDIELNHLEIYYSKD